MVFSKTQTKEIKDFYDTNGYVTISDLLNATDVNRLSGAFDEAVEKGDILIDKIKWLDCDDTIYKHPTFESYVKDERLINLAELLFDKKGLELQHSKLNAKPMADQGAGKVNWHQDFPFFPHTNFDLAAFGIHIDDEDMDSGPLNFIPKSHKFGPLSHCDGDEFKYECMEKELINKHKYETVCCKAGWVTFHHCLTLHCSEQKRNNKPRRFLVYQLRALDNIQLAGVLWKCTGLLLKDGKGAGKARFADGSSVEIRGKGGRLFDKFGKLAPNKP